MITKGKVCGPRRCVLYGTAGIGKTTWGCSAPGALLLPVEDNGGVVDCDQFQRPKDWKEIMDCCREAYTAPNQTFVVDTLDWMERIIHAQVAEDNKVRTIEDIGYGKGYVMAIRYWREFLTALDAIRSKGKTIILLAHSQIQRYEAPDSQAYDRFVPRMHKASSALFAEWCDELFFAHYEVFVNKDGLKTKATGDGTRLVSVTETPAWLAKNRLGLSKDLPMDFSKYMETWPK